MALSGFDPDQPHRLLQSSRREAYRISEARFHEPVVGQIVLPANS